MKCMMEKRKKSTIMVKRKVHDCTNDYHLGTLLTSAFHGQHIGTTLLSGDGQTAQSSQLVCNFICSN